MNYFNENKKAWEEAFEHKLPGWGEENYERLMNEHLPFLTLIWQKSWKLWILKGKQRRSFAATMGGNCFL